MRFLITVLLFISDVWQLLKQTYFAIIAYMFPPAVDRYYFFGTAEAIPKTQINEETRLLATHVYDVPTHTFSGTASATRATKPQWLACELRSGQNITDLSDWFTELVCINKLPSVAYLLSLYRIDFGHYPGPHASLRIINDVGEEVCLDINAPL